MGDVWVVECSVAGSVQGQAGWESKAVEGQSRTEQWSLKEGMEGENDAALAGDQRCNRSYTTSGEAEKKGANLMSRLSRCVLDDSLRWPCKRCIIASSARHQKSPSDFGEISQVCPACTL